MANPPTANKVKLPGKRRRAFGWTLLLLGLLVAAVWVASGWWSLGLNSRAGSFGLSAGAIYWVRLSVREEITHYPTDWKLWSGWNPNGQLNYDGRDRAYGVFTIKTERNKLTSPSALASLLFWPIPLLLWTPAALLLRSGILARRRAVSGLCKKCGYSLAGLAAGAPCPECGKASAELAVNTSASGS